MIGIFPGSFDIFTNGHIAIARKALSLVDELHIIVANNPQKKYLISEDLRVAIIKSQFKISRVYVTYTNGLVVDYATTLGEKCVLIRGVRNMTDMIQELTLADINEEMSGFSTIFIPTENRYRNVSSSFVKELWSHNKDISKYVPIEVTDVLRMAK